MFLLQLVMQIVVTFLFFHFLFPTSFICFSEWKHDPIGSEGDGSDDEFNNGNERSCLCVVM